MDVLKENEKVSLDDSSMIVAIEDAVGFVEEQSNMNVFEQLRTKENLTQKEQSSIDLAEVSAKSGLTRRHSPYSPAS